APGACALLSTPEFNTDNFRIFPNPLNGNILYYTADESLTVKVFDILGKEVFSRQKAADDNHIDVSNLKAGVYIVQFTSPSTGAKVIKKLIKQ
ncbi:MAG: T9SS type A sorting domain-containing protein, partial [Flavobacteriaceae bacterium]|nr:T9SS type A sorting domain-containing protein [Flavobacteriaceae bacterium]